LDYWITGLLFKSIANIMPAQSISTCFLFTVKSAFYGKQLCNVLAITVP